MLGATGDGGGLWDVSVVVAGDGQELGDGHRRQLQEQAVVVVVVASSRSFSKARIPVAHPLAPQQNAQGCDPAAHPAACQLAAQQNAQERDPPAHVQKRQVLSRLPVSV